MPPKPIRELRELLRYRRKLVESRSAARNRWLKRLESATIKLASVASDVFGVSGQRMLQALLEGEQTPQQMAELAKGRLRDKRAQLEEVLEGGRLEEHHRFQLGRQQVETDLAELERHLFEKLAPTPRSTPSGWRSQAWTGWWRR